MRLSTPETANLGSETRVVSAEPDRWQSLGALPDGAVGWVRQLGGGREFAGRMAALGFTLGVNVTVIRRVDGGPLIVEVRDTRVALGHDEADLVFVEGGQRPRESPSPSMTIALVGQPNAGKSTVFNLLTGFAQHVGNWPGKTVDQKSGVCHHKNRTLQVVDLPGTYSLTANSVEERIARDFILQA